MSFAATSILSFCRNEPTYPNPLGGMEKATLAVDATLAVAALVAILFFTGVIPGLPQGLGQFAWCAGGAAALLLIPDVIAGVVKYLKFTRERDAQQAISSERPEAAPVIITEVAPVIPNEDQEREALRTPCHEVLPGLFLGNGRACLEATGLPGFYEIGPSSKRGPAVDTSNPHQFKGIMSFCPPTSISPAPQNNEFSELSADQLRKFLKKQGISWHNYGKAAMDDAENWKALVYDCTFPDKHPDKPLRGNAQEIEKIFQDKKVKMDQVDVKEWFADAFKAIDKGRKKGNFLIHCQMGQSRSATILAAYLINRYGCTAEVAISALKSKRLCVKSKFILQLKAYERALHGGIPFDLTPPSTKLTREQRFDLDPIPQAIKAAPEYVQETTKSREAVKIPCHEILPGLFLGDQKAFAQTTGFPTVKYDTEIDTSNPNQFQTILSVTSFPGMMHDYTDVKEKAVNEFNQSFANQGITWKRFGDGFPDLAKSWFTLVHATTAENPQLFNTLEELNTGFDQYQEECRNNHEKDVKKWFEKAFQAIDAGLKKGNVLVHCSAGQSRSVTLMAAFLIKRHGVTTEEALNYIANRRPCIHLRPPFFAQLQAYETALRGSA